MKESKLQIEFDKQLTAIAVAEENLRNQQRIYYQLARCCTHKWDDGCSALEAREHTDLLQCAICGNYFPQSK